MSESPTASHVLEEITTAGNVTAEQVEKLRECVNADWIVDRHETEILFKANQAIGDNDEHCPEWGDFLIDSVTRLLVRDMETPGEIDEDEGDWLGDLISQFGVGNASEKRLFSEIRRTARTIKGKARDILQA